MTTSTMDTRLIPTVSYSAPTTGSTINASTSGNVTHFINPAGTILALTFSLNPSPTDGDMVTIASSQIVTGLTMSGGTVIGPLTSMAVGTFATYQYSADATKWFRVG